jgi:Flp pilus assembly protein TadG
MSRDDRGSASLELVLITPALIVLLLFVVFVGRLEQARGDVDRAARDAARAASIARSSDEARSQGEAAARSTLQSGGVTCRGLTVAVKVDDFAPGGSVAATVTCDVDLADVALLGVPGRRTLTAAFSEPVDVYRGTR